MRNTILTTGLIFGMLALMPLAYAAEVSMKGLPMHKNKIQLFRNATMKITYAGRTFLTDPMLSAKGELRSFAGIASNPTVELSFPVAEILTGVESVIVSHLHPDHYDKAASEALPKEMLIFCQPGDEEQLSKDGFKSVMPVETSRTWRGITITRTGGNHGKGKILEYMGKVSGFVLQAAGEPTVYWVGDSIWCKEVEDTINTFKPDIIITHSGGATIPGHEPIVMDAEQTLATLKSAPKATVVAIHMESLDHCVVSRKKLREIADNAGIPASRLIIPEDGSEFAF